MFYLLYDIPTKQELNFILVLKSNIQKLRFFYSCNVLNIFTANITGIIGISK